MRIYRRYGPALLSYDAYVNGQRRRALYRDRLASEQDAAYRFRLGEIQLRVNRRAAYSWWRDGFGPFWGPAIYFCRYHPWVLTCAAAVGVVFLIGMGSGWPLL